MAVVQPVEGADEVDGGGGEVHDEVGDCLGDGEDGGWRGWDDGGGAGTADFGGDADGVLGGGC